MIDGQQIRAARERAGLTQQQLGEAVGVGLRTIGNWERGETVPRNREAAIRAVLADHLNAPGGSPLATVSDVELIAELARRLGRASNREQVMGNAEHPAPNTDPDQLTPQGWDVAADRMRNDPQYRMGEREIVEALGPRPVAGEVRSAGSGGAAGRKRA